MRRIDLTRTVAHPALVGAVYMLAAAAWAARSPTVDERAGGAQARQLEALVHARFGHEITRIGIAVLAASVAIGAVLGCTAWAMLAVRDAIGRRTGRQRSVLWETAILLMLVAALHGAIVWWGMAHDPSLYVDAWYAHGGLRRTVQVLATDVLGPNGVIALAGLAAIVWIGGSGGQWLDRGSRLVHLVKSRPWETAGVTAAIAGIASLAHVPTATAAPAADASHPNVIVLAADSLRNDHLDARTAPHLTALAARGTRFDRAYVSLPRTFPSWVTLLTGRYPHHHGIRSMFPAWAERARDFDAVPERLTRAGYTTAVVSDYAGDIFSRIDLGFATVDVPDFDFRQLVRQRALEREAPLMPFLHTHAGRLAFPVMREMNDAADPAMLARDAIRMMRRLEPRGPFLLVVFFSTAHFPYAAPWPYYRRFTDPDYRGRYKYDRPVGLGSEAPADARDQAQVRGLYDGAVSAIDDAAQWIIDAVAKDGAAGRTVFVVTADHGETLWDNGHGLGHGDHLFGDEGTHVPLAIIDPRHVQARLEPTLVRDVDFAPTLYSLTGVEPPADLDGRSLVPSLEGQALAQRPAYAETGLWFTEDIPGLSPDLRLPYPGIAHLTEVDTEHADEIVLSGSMRLLTIVAKHRMVRDERWKLVYVPTRAGVHWMLFDTVADPGEVHDVSAAHPEVLARMQGQLWSWMREDPDMTEHGGYLVPRDPRTRTGVTEGAGLVRLE